MPREETWVVRFGIALAGTMRAFRPNVASSRLLVPVMVVALTALGACAPTLSGDGGFLLGGRPKPTVKAEQPPTPAGPKVETEEEVRREPAPTRAPAPAAPAPALSPPPVESGPIRVGLLLPLSGPSRSVGEALLDAAQMALFDAGNDRLTLLPRDTRGTPEGAAAAAQSALAEGAEIILGPLFSASVRAAAPLARERGVNMVALSTDRTVAGDGVYLIGFMPDQQVERVVAYAVRQGLRRFAALAPASPYGTAVVGGLRQTLARLGADLMLVTTYDPQAADISETVRRFSDYERRRQELLQQRRGLEGKTDQISLAALERLRRLETMGEVSFDAVVLPEGGSKLRAVAPLLPFYDIDPRKIRLIGTGLWDEPDIGAEPSLVGGWFAAPGPELATQFRQRFQATYGHRPPRIASLGYDAVALTAALAGDGSGKRYGREALAASNGFAGYDGIFRFGANGIAERGLAILQVESSGLRVIDPAPKSFEALTN